jgi:hypothetical protein
MACTYSTIEIQRTPEFRVYKKCLFRNLSCAEVRGSGQCPLLKGAPAREAVMAASAPEDVKGVLNDELKRIDEIPSLGGKQRTPEEVRTTKIQRTESTKPNANTGEVDLLRAELSDFMDKIEPGKIKPAVQEDGEASKGVQGESRKTRAKKAIEK